MEYNIAINVNLLIQNATILEEFNNKDFFYIFFVKRGSPLFLHSPPFHFSIISKKTAYAVHIIHFYCCHYNQTVLKINAECEI